MTGPAPLTWASRALHEAVMGFLALVALGTAIGPLVFDVSADTDRLFSIVEVLILALFVIEFAVQFAVASDRSSWLRNPWRIVDAVCILGPLVSFLPQVSDTVRGALVFRFLRIGRAVAFGARAGAVAVQRRPRAEAALHRGAPVVTVVKPSDRIPRESTWTELLTSDARDGAAWYHVANIDRARLSELAAASGVSDHDWTHFHDLEGGTHIKTEPNVTSLFLWLPTVAANSADASRTRLLVHVTPTVLLTATPFPEDLTSGLTARPPDDIAGLAFAVRKTYRILSLLCDRYRSVAQRQDEEIRRLEEAHVDGRGTKFLGEAFRLQRELTGASADLWRVKVIVQKMADGKLPLPGVDAENDSFLRDLLSEFDDVDQDFRKLKEDLTSLMELHMNITSFEMNKFMKLLAIIGFLGLIPSVAGGLLGMNVAGNPWPVTLAQVAFGIAMGMAISLYVFAIKGWLR